jgi:hypothetical protein
MIRVKGLKPLMDAFEASGMNAPRYAAKALYEEATEAFSISQLVVPVEYGALLSSGRVLPFKMMGTVATCQIEYGGTAAPYAAYVHELPPSRARHDPPTRWKYLEFPVKLYAEGMGARMTTRVLDMIHKGGF